LLGLLKLMLCCCASSISCMSRVHSVILQLVAC
jgi:hypothetical protein